MGRKANDGRGRLGGRAKGTPNKPKSPATDWVGEMLAVARPTIDHSVRSKSDVELFPRLLPALLVAEALNRLTAALYSIGEASGLAVDPNDAAV